MPKYQKIIRKVFSDQITSTEIIDIAEEILKDLNTIDAMATSGDKKETKRNYLIGRIAVLYTELQNK